MLQRRHRARAAAGLLVALTGCTVPPAAPGDATPTEVEADSAADGGSRDAGSGDGAAAAMGRACSSHQRCRAGLRCETTGQPGGLCTKRCRDDADCGSSRFACRGGLCRARCDPRSIIETCRTGYVCRILGKSAVCVGDCRRIGCSGDSGTCQRDSGLCLTAGGQLGAPCGGDAGGCGGTPNGTCLSVGTFYKGYCTVPCAPFTKPCPLDIKGATCAASTSSGTYCTFICDPKKPKCPHPTMRCVDVGNNTHLCIPRS